jgi:hypothetical protein
MCVPLPSLFKLISAKRNEILAIDQSGSRQKLRNPFNTTHPFLIPVDEEEVEGERLKVLISNEIY